MRTVKAGDFFLFRSDNEQNTTLILFQYNSELLYFFWNNIQIFLAILVTRYPQTFEFDCIYISRKVSCPFAKNWWNRGLELSYPYQELKGSFLIVISNNFCVKNKLMKAISILFLGNLFLRKKSKQRIRLYSTRLDFGIDLLPKTKTKPANSS